MLNFRSWKAFLSILFVIFSGLVISSLAFAESTELRESSLIELSHEKRVLALLSKVEEQQKWRQEIQGLYEQMLEHSDNNNGEISARHLKSLRELVTVYTEKMSHSIDKYRSSQIDFLNPDNIILINRDRETSVNYRYSRLARARALRASRVRVRTYRKTVTRVSINPDDNKGMELFEDFLYQVSNRVMVLENFSLGLIPFINNERFRFALIRDIKNIEARTIEAKWHSYINALYKSDNLGELLSMLNDNIDYFLKNNGINQSLFSLINNSEVGHYIQSRKNKSFFEDMMANMKQMSERRWDAYKKLGMKALYYASKAFGNTVGLVQSRRGYLYSMSKEEEDSLAKRMKPLDVMFEKTPFRLTDRFIPGHFGHNSIWTGTKEELKKIGIWDELPSLYMNAVENYGYRGISFQADIEEGARIIEALRPGVQINSLRDFLDIDDYVVMRAEECDVWEEGTRFCLTPEKKLEYLRTAFSQIGKDYDFAFDVNTEETIVCSELLYRTYLDIDFETTYTVGSYNISPDQVAYQGDEEGDIFTPVILYHKGKEVQENLRDVFYDLLHSEHLKRLKNEALKYPERSNK